MTVQAQEDGFRLLSSVVPVTVTARLVNIQLGQSVTTAYPGNNIQFSLQLTDNLTGMYLSRPVNVQLSIIPTTPAGTQLPNAVSSYIFTGITNTGQWTWTVPGEIATGQYDVTVTISSPYFTGTKTISQALTIVTPQVI
jgi:hypothetical protein